jgi:hypothetical protein
VRLRHFFENMVRREETASAFLATLLDYDPAFRRAFLRLALDDPGFDDHESWSVQVEEERVDVTLESPTMVVLIEDKISSGAKQQEQLLRYYRAAADAKSGKRTVAVYLAPRGIGIDEVDQVRRADLFTHRESDVACYVPWESIAEIVAGLPQSEASWFANSGMQEIERAIDRARQERYPALGDRALVRQIMDNAAGSMSTISPDVRLGRWGARDFEEILTYPTPVTVWLDAVFDVEPEPPLPACGRGPARWRPPRRALHVQAGRTGEEDIRPWPTLGATREDRNGRGPGGWSARPSTRPLVRAQRAGRREE